MPRPGLLPRIAAAPVGALAVEWGRRLFNQDGERPAIVLVDDLSYGRPWLRVELGPAGRESVNLDLAESYGWYDLRIRVNGAAHFERRYAGRVENGRECKSDPLIGRMARGTRGKNG